ncbi:MAG: deoxyhypusine synthase [Methanospirillaceae archaeon]|nr:deoxyhypusine synthase [Methanospirillaceae archaeon]
MNMRPTQAVVPEPDIETLLMGMSRTGFQGRKLGESLQVWKEMLHEPDICIMLGLSGAMIPAGMQELLIALVQNHFVDLIVSTGANIFHDVCEHCGIRHYLGHHHVDDRDLLSRGIDRIYDVFAYEKQFREVDTIIASFVSGIGGIKGSSSDFLKSLGKWLIETYPEGHSLTAACVTHDIPILVPALADSSIGIGLVIARRNGVSVQVDQIADADIITGMVEEATKTGVVYIGGGVPKNFIQQTQVIASIHCADCGGHDYAIQYTTDSPQFGGLSGCTFEEAISWGKESLQCRHVQCFCDATIALPLIVSALVSGGITRNRR